jgi:hypothetical protein
VESFLLSKPELRTGRVTEAYLLGDFTMSGALSADAEGNGATPEENLGRALALLQEVLEIVDSIDAPPEIGARAQGLIDSLEELQEPPQGD